MSEQEFVIPPTFVSLDGCKSEESLLYVVKLSLVEIFVATSTATGLPMRVEIRPTGPTLHPAHRHWNVPFTFQLPPATVRRYRKKLKAPNAMKLVLQHDSFAYGIQEWLGHALVPHLRLRILHFPAGWMGGKEESWRVELAYENDIIGQWNGPPASLGRYPLFTAQGSPLERRTGT